MFIPKECRHTINLDSKMHGGFSLVSYTVQYSKQLGFSEEEKDKIIGELIEAYSFDEMLQIFKRNFNSIVIIQYRNKII